MLCHAETTEPAAPLSSFACDVHGVKKELAVQEERGPNQPKGD